MSSRAIAAAFLVCKSSGSREAAEGSSDCFEKLGLLFEGCGFAAVGCNLRW